VFVFAEAFETLGVFDDEAGRKHSILPVFLTYQGRTGWNSTAVKFEQIVALRLARKRVRSIPQSIQSDRIRL
jgi:hypothetical protein